MAERLEFDAAPTAPPAGGSLFGDKVSTKKLSDLVTETEGGGRKLEFDKPSREQELRAQYLKEQLLPGEPGYSARLKDSATLGLMRPLGGLMRGVSGVFDPTSTFGERYRAGVGAEEDYANRAVANTPGVGGVLTDIAGGAGAVGAGTAAVKGGREALSKVIAQGAGTGAVEGAARNAKDVESATKGAALGGTVGAGTSAAVGGATKLIPGVAGKIKGAKEELRTVNQGKAPEDLKAAAKEGYQKLDNAGIAYAEPQTKALKAGIDDLAATNQYNPIAHSKISGFVDQLDKLAQNPAGAKFSELHNLRSALATEARGADESTRTAARKMATEIDKLIQNKPAVNPNNVDLTNIYPDATRLWKSASIADDVAWTAGKAERKAASKAGVNPDEANRAAFRPMLDKAEKPGAYSPFKGKGNEEQRDLLAKIVKGDKLQNVYRGAGAAAGSPATRLGLGALAGGLGISSGGIGALPLLSGAGALGGGMAKNMFDRLAAKRGEANIDALLRSITTGSSKPTNNMPSREALAVLLAKQAAQRGGAAFAASKTGEKKPTRVIIDQPRG